MFFRFIFLGLLLAQNAIAKPNIVVSIKPIHAIVSALTQGITTPKLLLQQNHSPHYFHLKHAQLSLLHQADLIISVHPNFEIGLGKALKNIAANKRLIVNDENLPNPHIWLSVDKMQDFAKRVLKKLTEIDPENTKTYQKNQKRLDAQLTPLKHHIAQQLSRYNNTKIALLDNTLAHFIKANHLHASQVTKRSHQDRLSIHQILSFKQTMQKAPKKCLISTIDRPKKQINLLIQGLPINTANIDIIGINQKQGAAYYIHLMNTITHKVAKCLQ